MDNFEFEGTLVLESLAEIGKQRDFYDAIDSDNFDLVRKLMEEVGTEESTIEMIIDRIENGE